MADARTRSDKGSLSLPPAPHLGVRVSSAGMTWLVALSLAPATAWGVFLFGVPALLVLAVSIGAAIVAEALSSLLLRRFTLHDGTAFLTGLIVGLLMPAGVPLFVPAAASAFAILVVKQSFGGLGRNWMNPAMAGIVFSLLSWSGPMSQWIPARGGVTDAAALPPLEALRNALAGPGAGSGTPLAILAEAGYRFSDLDSSIVSWINSHVLAFLGIALPPGSFDLIVGHVPGAIGTVSLPFLALGAALLLRRRVVRWHVPVFYVASFAVLSLVFGGLATGQGWLAGEPGFHVLSGSLLLGAFFAAPDPVTSPLTKGGKCLFGAVLGVLTFFTRTFGSLGDGVAVAIILGNCVTPLLDRWTQARAPESRKAEAG